MHALSAILFCALAVFGLYALLSRLALTVLPRGKLSVAVDARGMTADEILLWVKTARHLLEREGCLERQPIVLLSPQEQELLGTLRKEGVLVYTVNLPYL